MSKTRKILLIVACIIAALIVAAAIIVPRLLQVDRYRPYVILLIEQKTGWQVSMGRLSLTVLPTLTVEVDDLAIANPSGFPPGDWLRVGRINARLDASALWHRRIIIRSLVLNSPSLSLLSGAQGRWNYAVQPKLSANNAAPAQDPPAGKSVQGDPPADPPLFTLQSISAVSLKDGSLTMASLTPSGQPGAPLVVAQGVLADLKDIDLAAFANPRASAGAAAATGDLHVKSLEAGNLQMDNVVSAIQATPAAVELRNLKFDFYSGHGQGDILLNLAAPILSYTAQGNLSGVDAAALLARFPQARGQMTGTLDARFTFSGDDRASADPWAGKQGQGTLTVRKGRLPKLPLDKAVLQLARVAGMGPVSGDPSAFSSASLGWRLANDLIAAGNVRVLGNGVALNGSGTVGLAGAGRLDFQGMAEINAQKNALTNILADFSGATFSNGKLGVPFTLSGTLDQPQFRLNTRGALANSLGAPGKKPNQTQQDIQSLFNLFKRKK